MSFYINSYLWVIWLFAQYFFISYLSLRQSSNAALGIIWLLQLIPNWILICKYSNNLALDGFIYDFVVTCGWGVAVIVFNGKSFQWQQFAGIIFMICGIMLFKKTGV